MSPSLKICNTCRGYGGDNFGRMCYACNGSGKVISKTNLVKYFICIPILLILLWYLFIPLPGSKFSQVAGLNFCNSTLGQTAQLLSSSAAQACAHEQTDVYGAAFLVIVDLVAIITFIALDVNKRQ